MTLYHDWALHCPSQYDDFIGFVNAWYFPLLSRQALYGSLQDSIVGSWHSTILATLEPEVADCTKQLRLLSKWARREGFTIRLQRRTPLKQASADHCPTKHTFPQDLTGAFARRALPRLPFASPRRASARVAQLAELREEVRELQAQHAMDDARRTARGPLASFLAVHGRSHGARVVG